MTSGQTKTPPDDVRRRFVNRVFRNLLDFGFLEFHVLFGNRIVLFHGHFFGHGTAVFLGDVEEAGISGAEQLYFDCGSLGHRIFLEVVLSAARMAQTLKFGRNLAGSPRKSRGDQAFLFRLWRLMR